MTRRLFLMTFVTNERTGLYLLRVDKDDFGGIHFRTFYSSGQLTLSCQDGFQSHWQGAVSYFRSRCTITDDFAIHYGWWPYLPLSEYSWWAWVLFLHHLWNEELTTSFASSASNVSSLLELIDLSESLLSNIITQSKYTCWRKFFSHYYHAQQD